MTSEELIKNFQVQGIIRSVGPDKGGHWEVVSIQENCLGEKDGMGFGMIQIY